MTNFEKITTEMNMDDLTDKDILGSGRDVVKLWLRSEVEE